MPTPDNTYNPTTSEGPFSRYLDPAYATQQAEKEQVRPSGYMGATGKLAMFGGQILKGLTAGKMAAYARKEQEAYDQYEQAARRVQQVQNDPDVPNSVKAHAGLLLQQSFATLTKQQLKESKGHAKDDTPAGKVRQFLESVADRLGGPTPAGHTFGGTKDTKTAVDQLNELISGIYSGEAKYSIAKSFDQLQGQLNEAIKGGNYQTFQEASNDPKVRNTILEMYRLSPEQAQVTLGLAKQGLTPPTIAQQEDLRVQQLYKNQGTEPKPQQAPAQSVQSGQLLPGMVGVTAPVKATEAPKAEADTKSGTTPEVKPTSANGQSVGNLSFQPYQLPNGLKVTNPEDESLVLKKFGGNPTRGYFKRIAKDPNGNAVTERREVWLYPNLPGIVRDTNTGQRVDLSQGWQPTTAGDRDAVPKTTYTTVKRQGPGDTMVEERVELKPGEPYQYTPYRAPQRARSSSTTDEDRELLRESRRLGNEEKQDKVSEAKRKRNAEALVNKIVSDIGKDSKDPSKGGLTPEQLLNQRLDDFGTYYGNDPRMEGNYDAVREALMKRKGEVTAMGKRAADKASSEKKARDSGAIPKQAKSKGKLTDEKVVADYLKKANGDVNKARQLAKSDGWEI